jgi:putative membrane protein
MLRTALLGWALLAAAIGLTAWLVPGIEIDGGVGALLVVALAFSLVQVVVGTILRIVTAPLRLITLGLIGLVVNAVLLAITAWWVDRLHVDGAVAAIVGGVLISVFSTLLLALLTRRRAGAA